MERTIDIIDANLVIFEWGKENSGALSDMGK